MKIDARTLIQVRIPAHDIGIFHSLKKGAEVNARIVIRHNDREAVLDIGGKRVRAEFLKGVPENDSVLLKLERADGRSFVFKLVASRGGGALADVTALYTIFSGEGAGKTARSMLRHSTGSGITGIYDMHAMFFQPDDRKKKRAPTAEFLNRLMSLGYNNTLLLKISLLLFRAEYLAVMIPLLLSRSWYREILKGWEGETDTEAEETVNNILESVDNRSDARDEILSRLTELLLRSGVFEDPDIGELPFFDGERFVPLRYIRHGKGFIVSVRLSELGDVEIMAKELEDSVSVAIFCSESEGITHLSGGLSDLHGAFQKRNIRATVHIYNRADIINKIVEINSYLARNSELDITV